MPRALLIAVLLIAPVLRGQTTPVTTFGAIRTPEIQLGSGSTPTTVTVPPVVVVETSSVPAEPPVSNAPPASTALLATRHFDFIVAPVGSTSWSRGSMADSSISLGEYARHLRAQKGNAPNAMAQPSKPN